MKIIIKKIYPLLLVATGFLVSPYAAADAETSSRNPFIKEQKAEEKPVAPQVVQNVVAPGFVEIPVHNNQEIKNARWVARVNDQDVYFNESKQKFIYIDAPEDEKNKPVKTSLSGVAPKSNKVNIDPSVSAPLPQFIPVNP